MPATYLRVDEISPPHEAKRRSHAGLGINRALTAAETVRAISSTIATPDALSSAPGPPESESPCAQKRMYFERSRPGRVATTVCASSLPLRASRANDTATF